MALKLTESAYFRLVAISDLGTMLETLAREFPGLLPGAAKRMADGARKQMADAMKKSKGDDFEFEPLHPDTRKIRKRRGIRGKALGGRLLDKNVLRVKGAYSDTVRQVGFISSSAERTARMFVGGKPNSYLTVYAANMLKPPPQGRQHKPGEWKYIDEWRRLRDMARVASLGMRTYPARGVPGAVEQSKMMREFCLQKVKAALHAAYHGAKKTPKKAQNIGAVVDKPLPGLRAGGVESFDQLAEVLYNNSPDSRDFDAPDKAAWKENLKEAVYGSERLAREEFKRGQKFFQSNGVNISDIQQDFSAWRGKRRNQRAYWKNKKKGS